jgi:hypothetical protein
MGAVGLCSKYAKIFFFCKNANHLSGKNLFYSHRVSRMKPIMWNALYHYFADPLPVGDQGIAWFGDISTMQVWN